MNDQKLFDATWALSAVMHHPASGITWVKLEGDDEFEWVVSSRPDTPEGYTCISGDSNGSYRYVKSAALDALVQS